MPFDEFSDGQEAAAGLGNRASDNGCAVCHVGNWVHVRYDYTEGDPVTDASFVVQKPNGGKPGGEVLHEDIVSVGPDSSHKFVHVDLGDYDGEVEVFFFDDPTDPEPYVEPEPVEDTRGWLRRAAESTMEGITDAASWTGEVLQGDFNENMSTGQIVTNALVTAVPGIDQVADARDLIANGKALIWDKRYGELAVWVGVFACLIGLVPSLGSLAKGVIKIVWKNAGEIGRLLIYINRALHRTGVRINGYRKVREIGEALEGMVEEVGKKFDEFLDDCAATAVRLRMSDTVATIAQVRAMARAKFAEVATEVSARIARGLTRYATTAWIVMPRQSIVVTRAMRIARHTYREWQETMARVGFDETALEAGAVVKDDTFRVFKESIDVLAERWGKEILADPACPPSIREFAEANPAFFLDKLKTFSDKPEFITFDGPPQSLYRVIKEPNGHTGAFWSRAEPPTTEAEWRARDAVRNDWNEGGAFIRAEVPPPPAGLVGKIAPQELPLHPEHILRGGGEQVWLPGPREGAISRDQVKSYWHTDWNERAPQSPTRATMRAGNPEDCDL